MKSRTKRSSNTLKTYWPQREIVLTVERHYIFETAALATSTIYAYPNGQCDIEKVDLFAEHLNQTQVCQAVRKKYINILKPQ